MTLESNLTLKASSSSPYKQTTVYSPTILDFLTHSNTPFTPGPTKAWTNSPNGDEPASDKINMFMWKKFKVIM